MFEPVQTVLFGRKIKYFVLVSEELTLCKRKFTFLKELKFQSWKSQVEVTRSCYRPPVLPVLDEVR